MGRGAMHGEIVAFSAESAIAVPEGGTEGLSPGARLWLEEPLSLYPCDAWMGRAIDSLGRPLDGLGPLPQGRRGVRLRRPRPMRCAAGWWARGWARGCARWMCSPPSAAASAWASLPPPASANRR
ncbi:hypothetical protein [Teichococcus aestuarii]|uniref:hypothetical protein n=1 Tax=Teichococcus aestuarii TaxID=568898 RepID=UPI003610B053